MRPVRLDRGVYYRRRAAAAGVLALLAAATVIAATSRTSTGLGQPGGSVVVQPDLGVPATDVNPIGMPSSAEAGEAWAYGSLASGSATFEGGQPIPTDSTGFVLLRRTEGSGWGVFGGALDSAGQQLGFFSPLSGAGSGRVTPNGGVAVVGLAGATRAAAAPAILVRNPGDSSARLLAAPPAPSVLAAGEALATDTPADASFAAVDEGGHTGVLVAPQRSSGAITGILHWDGSSWSREPIDLPAGISSIRDVRALAANSAGNAWMLADANGSPSPGVVLFQRVPGSTPHWVNRSLGSSPFALQEPGASYHVGSIKPLAYPADSLTVTDDGVWVDGSMVRSDASAQRDTFTLFYNASSHEVSSWCNFADLPQVCPQSLGASLSSAAGLGYRSFAWGGDSFGTRVVTNPLKSGQGQSTNRGNYLVFQDGVFTRMPGVGAPRDGTPAGGAFSSTDEGWLGGDDDLAHVTRSPQSNNLQSFPVPFRDPLVALAGEPGKSPGDPSAQAIAVGDHGAIARYTPGHGWAPEFLLNSNGTRATPRLRGVAWPEPGRAYAVGDLGEMWLWQSATGIWEKDQAVPLEFNGNLMDVGFQPGSDSRGYAVGRDGVLLRYGKNWEQDQLPAGAEHDELTHVAFAGSQALVAGGRHLLVNDGAGWRIDQGISELLHNQTHDIGSVYTVAGLPDGGAVAAGFHFVAKRDSINSPWRMVDQPLSGGTAVAVAAIREGGQVRAILSLDRDSSRYPQNLGEQQQPDPSQPPLVLQPFGLPLNGFLLRETAQGWRDEQHAGFRAPSGSAAGQLDAPIEPDPIFALLLDPQGQGWSVGGKTGELFDSINKNRAHSAGVYRYPATGSSASGASTALPALPAGVARLAIGGDARCLGPCSDLALQGIRPDVGLGSAVAQASSLTSSAHGPRAFLYTGGRLNSGTLDSTEADRYAGVAAGGALPFYPALASHDAACGVSQSGVTSAIGHAFNDFSAPFGHGGQPGNIDTGNVPLTPEANSAVRTHYAFDTTGPDGAVRVIVIDNSCGSLQSSDPGQNPNEPQQPWLQLVLADARARGVPAIVIGSRDLNPNASDNVASDGGTDGPTACRRRGERLLLRQPAREPPLPGSAGRRQRDPGVRQRLARLRNADRQPVPVLRRERLPAGRGQRRSARSEHQPRARRSSPDPGARGSRARRDRRSVAAAQSRGAVPGFGPAPARRRARSGGGGAGGSVRDDPATSLRDAPPATAGSSPSSRSARRMPTSETSSSTIPPRRTCARSISTPRASRSRTRRPGCSARSTPARRPSPCRPASWPSPRW